MIPILYESTEKDFKCNGIGFLNDCISCAVTEERNGIYEAELKYPLTGRLYNEISVDRIIKVKANETSDLQLFRIYKNSKPLNGIVTYKAQHISYDLNLNPIIPFESSKSNATTVINEVLNKCYFEHNFTAVSDINTISKINITEPCSARNCLGGTKGSILDNFGGEYEFDNYTIHLHKQRGADNGVSIEYGKNLTDITSDTDISSTYTSIMPYAQDSNGNIVTLSEKVISLDTQKNFGCSRTKIIDFSDKFDVDEKITEAKLKTLAQNYLSNNAIDKISTNIKVSFVQLWQSKEYENYALLERVKLCDTVTIKYKALGVSAKAKVIKTVYNTLNERYENLELGDAKSSFSDTLNKVNSDIQTMQTAINNQPSAMQKAIDNATNIITGQSGGYVVLNPKEYPQEILIMNEDSIEKSTKIWRLNLGGFGYSKNGYNGKFETAITMDGSIVANFITTGILNADLIKAGTISDENGNMSLSMINGNLEFKITDKGKMKLNTNGLTIYDKDNEVLASIFKSSAGRGVLTANRVLIGKRDSETTDIFEDSGKGYIRTDKIKTDELTSDKPTINIDTLLQSSKGYRVVDSNNNEIFCIYNSADIGVCKSNRYAVTDSNGNVIGRFYATSDNKSKIETNSFELVDNGNVIGSFKSNGTGSYLETQYLKVNEAIIMNGIGYHPIELKDENGNRIYVLGYQTTINDKAGD